MSKSVPCGGEKHNILKHRPLLSNKYCPACSIFQRQDLANLRAADLMLPSVFRALRIVRKGSEGRESVLPIMVHPCKNHQVAWKASGMSKPRLCFVTRKHSCRTFQRCWCLSLCGLGEVNEQGPSSHLWGPGTDKCNCWDRKMGWGTKRQVNQWVSLNDCYLQIGGNVAAQWNLSSVGGKSIAATRSLWLLTQNKSQKQS